MSSTRAMHALAAVAEDQWGLVTRAQALAAGVPTSTLSRLTAPDGLLERITHGVYRLRGSLEATHLPLRAAWLQLNPTIPGWQRLQSHDPTEGVVSYRSAAHFLGLGDLIADTHEFTLPHRRQSRRDDVRIHQQKLASDEWSVVDGLPVTRPERIVVDLLSTHEDGSAIAMIAADALQRHLTYPDSLSAALSPIAQRYGSPPGDGAGLLEALLVGSGINLEFLLS